MKTNYRYPTQGKNKKAAYELSKRLNVEHITQRTNIFSTRTEIVEQDLDPHTLKIVEKRFTIWFNSWVRDDLDTVLNSILEKKEAQPGNAAELLK